MKVCDEAKSSFYASRHRETRTRSAKGLAKAFDIHPAIIMFSEYESSEIKKDP
jgi:hypothetical protein